MSVKDFIRSKPKPTLEEAMNFTLSVMEEKGVYEFPENAEHALKQLREKAVDLSEQMALAKLEYALE